MSGLAALVAVLAACLAATVAFELRPSPQARSEPPRQVATRAEAPLAVTAPADRGSLVATLLARPLFGATRRPAEVAAAVTAAADPTLPLPRMSGILIDGPRRSAIFAAPPGGKSVIVGEGGKIGPFTVESIGPQRVVVAGPDGRRTLRTSFDPNLPPPSPVALPVIAPQFPGIAVPGAPPTGAPDPAAGFAPPPQAGAAR